MSGYRILSNRHILWKLHTMKRPVLLVLLLLSCIAGVTQQTIKPCTQDTLYRQFDYWIGDWEVFNPKGQKAGDSRVELMLDSCILLENWQSQGNYAGKSFNTYNSSLKQWQQTWVDDKGELTEYFGGIVHGNMVLATKPFAFKTDTMAIRRMTFYNLAPGKMRQHGEISKDDGNSWATEFDLEYRRKK